MINIKSAQQKEYYDRKHSPETFEAGAEVLMENTAQKQRKGGKLADKFLGPYTINRHVGKGLYELKNKSGKILQKKVNVIRLKRFYSNNVRLLLQYYAIPFIMFYLCNSIYLIFIALLQCHTLNEQDNGNKTGSDEKEDDGNKIGSDGKEDDDGKKTGSDCKEDDDENNGVSQTFLKRPAEQKDGKHAHKVCITV